MAKEGVVKKTSAVVFGVLIVLLIAELFGAGCKVTPGEGFAIYLTRDHISPAKMDALSQADLADRPLVSLDDIISYYSQTHVLKLTSEAYESISTLEVPISGISFVVCVDKNPIYWGAFWSSFSSASFNGVTITKPFIFLEPGLISLELGYPAPSFYSGEDPRNSPEILTSLERAGKLVKTLDSSTIQRLPSPAKGYELYSWQQEGRWHFTLITGTNRGKTLDEIVSGENTLSETGLLKISVVGVEAIKDALSKIPIDTGIAWFNEMRNPSDQTGIKIQLPPQEIRDTIRNFALQSRLDFYILE
jgi:hypothetical protein